MPVLEIIPLKYLVSASVLVVSLLVAGVLQRRSAQTKRLPYPPGPKRHPLIGNLLDLLSHNLWEKALEWGKDYGVHCISGSSNDR